MKVFYHQKDKVMTFMADKQRLFCGNYFHMTMTDNKTNSMTFPFPWQQLMSMYVSGTLVKKPVLCFFVFVLFFSNVETARF